MVQAFPDIWQGPILDVGCRSGELHRILAAEARDRITHVGVDLRPPASALANLERGLPFRDEVFEVVVALDVLEHINEIHAAFAELCRISRTFVLILLPNAYEMTARIRFLLGKPLSAKYGLPVAPPLDRHRWLFSLTEARTFVHSLAPESGFALQHDGYVVGPRRARSLGARACETWPNLLCQWYLALLKREKSV